MPKLHLKEYLIFVIIALQQQYLICVIIVFFATILTKLKNLNFHPLEVVSRYRDPQLQVGENYSYLYNLNQNICDLDFLLFFSPSNFSFLKIKLSLILLITTIVVFISRPNITVIGNEMCVYMSNCQPLEVVGRGSF